MAALALEMGLYLLAALLLGALLGFLVWGWGRRSAIEAAHIEGRRSARTSMDGDQALREQYESSEKECKRLEVMITRQRDQIRRLEDAVAARDISVAGLDPDDTVETDPVMPAEAEQQPVESKGDRKSDKSIVDAAAGSVSFAAIKSQADDAESKGWTAAKPASPTPDTERAEGPVTIRPAVVEAEQTQDQRAEQQVQIPPANVAEPLPEDGGGPELRSRILFGDREPQALERGKDIQTASGLLGLRLRRTPDTQAAAAPAQPVPVSEQPNAETSFDMTDAGPASAEITAEDVKDDGHLDNSADAQISDLVPDVPALEPEPEPEPEPTTDPEADVSHLATADVQTPVAGMDGSTSIDPQDLGAVGDAAEIEAAAASTPDPETEPQHDPDDLIPPPASLLDDRPDDVDDLKQINGVGPVMEKVLNDQGVYLFQQLATFTDDDVEWINAAIDAFPGRVRRDGWVEQAKQLYKEKYGHAHDAPEAI